MSIPGGSLYDVDPMSPGRATFEVHGEPASRPNFYSQHGVRERVCAATARYGNM